MKLSDDKSASSRSSIIRSMPAKGVPLARDLTDPGMMVNFVERTDPLDVVVLWESKGPLWVVAVQLSVVTRLSCATSLLLWLILLHAVSIEGACCSFRSNCRKQYGSCFDGMLNVEHSEVSPFLPASIASRRLDSPMMQAEVLLTPPVDSPVRGVHRLRGERTKEACQKLSMKRAVLDTLCN